MKSYWQALQAATELCNMPEPNSKPAKFIEWAEDICELISSIYEHDYDQVSEDLREKLIEDGVIETD